MKGKKLLSLLLALALCVGLLVPAAAAAYTDLVNADGTPHWATQYINELTTRGMFQGYGNGRVGPNDMVVNTAALALCARMSIPQEATRLQLAADRADELDAVLSDRAQDWFYKEAATCLELGIITHDELAALVRPNGLGQDKLNVNTSRADFARYVVRAMGVEDLLRTGGDSTVSFADAAQIPNELLPYVNLLSNWGVVNGVLENGLYYFRPDKPITRAECATMLCRAVQQMESRGISIEIPRFTKYDWYSGYIKSVEPTEGGRLLTLTSPFGEERTVALPTGISIYRYNLPVEFTALQTGAFARLCCRTDGTVESVRVTPAVLLASVTGGCDDLSPNEIVVDGQSFAIDRFTQVSAGGKVGDTRVIDYDAAYTKATLTHDAAGRVLHLSLSGGTRREVGILQGVTVSNTATGTRTAITVTSYSGTSTVYQVPGDAAVTVGGAAGELRPEILDGRHVTLRVSDNDLTHLVSVEVNLTDRYLQGILNRTSTTGDGLRTAEITALGGTRSTKYELSGDCAVSFMGTETTLDKLPTGVFVTAKMEGGTLTTLACYQGYETTSGLLTNIGYSDPLTLEVTLESGATATFSLPLSQLSKVSILRGGESSDITNLRTGDRVQITVLYNDVVQIDSTPQAANVTGTLQTVAQNADGSVQLTLLFSDGSSAVYTANSATTVTRNGKPAALADVRPGGTAALVTDGTVAVSIELSGAAQSPDQIYGTVLQVDVQGRTVTLLVKDLLTGQEAMRKVYIPSSVSIQNISGGAVAGVNRLELGDILRVWGSPRTDGVFAATLVVREA